MTSRPPTDDSDADVRPVVGRPQSAMPLYLFLGGLIAVAILLFIALDARRRALIAPETRVAVADRGIGDQAVPALYIPSSPPESLYVRALPPREAPSLPRQLTPEPLPAAAARVLPAQPTAVPQFLPPPAADTSLRGNSSPVLVIDSAGETAGAVVGAPPVAIAAGQGGDRPVPAVMPGPARVRAGRLANPSTTVPQGTSIPAVLETALDSTRPGQARAIVSLDVRGFDGEQVLIPRGSRLYGEYLADLQAGQNRALIQWTKLLRPDGTTIALASPAADRLGRAGVRGRVNSHFFERFTSAILQSSVDIGIAVASRSIGDGGGVVLLPGGFGQVGQQQPMQQIQPTLTVRHGTSVAVIVARDLDFTGVMAGR